MPTIIDSAEFESVQAQLKTRSPAMTVPRVVSGPTLLAGICFCAGCGVAMTLRTGKSGRYRYYTCCTKARQGETGCNGRTVPMEKLDSVVAEHIEHRLLQSKRLEHTDAERAEGTLDRLGPSNRAAGADNLRQPSPQAHADRRWRLSPRSHTRAGPAHRSGGERSSHDGIESVLLRTLVAAESAKTAGFGVPSSVPKWRTRRDSNSRPSESKSDALSS